MIYLASPYSHPVPSVREGRFIAVCKVAADLIRAGHVVFCPIAHSHPLEVYGGLDGGWDLWQAQDLPMLDCCHELHVAAFPGWAESVGVAGEIQWWSDYKVPKGYPEPIYHFFQELPQ